MKKLLSVAAIAFCFAACNASQQGGGVGTKDRIPAQPMPGSPAAQMQQQGGGPPATSGATPP
jgi:hypothetical protein